MSIVVGSLTYKLHFNQLNHIFKFDLNLMHVSSRIFESLDKKRVNYAARDLNPYICSVSKLHHQPWPRPHSTNRTTRLTMSLMAPTTGSSDSVSTGLTDTLRFCSLCKKLQVPIASKFKLCSNCREKNRDAARSRRIRNVLASVNTKERVDPPAAKLGRVVSQTSINGSSVCGA